jgi:hypothetical protein
MNNDTVYANENEALNDINRLIRLNDYEGVKLRVLSIYKEKGEQENLLKEIDNDLDNLREELDKKDQLINEYENVMRVA